MACWELLTTWTALITQQTLCMITVPYGLKPCEPSRTGNISAVHCMTNKGGNRSAAKQYNDICNRAHDIVKVGGASVVTIIITMLRCMHLLALEFELPRIRRWQCQLLKGRHACNCPESILPVKTWHKLFGSNMTYAMPDVGVADTAIRLARMPDSRIEAVLTGGERALGKNARDTPDPVVCRIPTAHNTTHLTDARLPPSFQISRENLLSVSRERGLCRMLGHTQKFTTTAS